MNQEASHYWIIAFSLDAAIVVEAGTEAASNPVKTYQVNYNDLRYKYVDVEAETKMVMAEKREKIDPRIIVDPNTHASTILSMPQMQGKAVDIEELVLKLGLARKLAESHPENYQKEITEYERLQKLSDDELYQEIHSELKQKNNYTPNVIENFTKPGYLIGLRQAGYFMVEERFPAMDSTLDFLYQAWESIKHDRERVLYMRGERNKLDSEAMKRCSDFFDTLFN